MFDFIQLLNRLSDYQVEFVLVGGLAAATYGSTLVPQDVDVCVKLEVPNLVRLKNALLDLNPVHRKSLSEKGIWLSLERGGVGYKARGGRISAEIRN